MAAVQITAQGFLFQMVPAYVLSVILLLVSIPQLFQKANAKTGKVQAWRRTLRIIGNALLTLVLIIAIGLPVIFPAMPDPTGTHKVNVTSYEWVDASRHETFSTNPADLRDLMVTVWYPADISTSTSGNIFPVLVFSHGWGMDVHAYSVEMEDIASHGYVIFGIDHPYEADEVRYPDGRVVRLSTDLLNALQSKQTESETLVAQYKAATDPAVKDSLARQMDSLMEEQSQNNMKIWTEDTSFVLDKIEELNNGKTGNIFTGKLDMSNTGVFGHSFGGAVAGLVCLRDSRFKTGLNMDGMQFGEYDYAASGSLQQPFMEMTSVDMPAGINDYMYDRINNWTYYLYVASAKHNNFTDAPLIAPILRQTSAFGCGPINPGRMHTIIDKYTLAFFDKYLKGIDSLLLKGPSPDFPEVQYKMHGPPVNH